MTNKKFQQIWDQLVEKEKDTLIKKGTEYSGNENRFQNFEHLSKELDIHPIQVLWVYASKHKDSIASFIRSKEVISNEDITGRIVDLKNYLSLLCGMIVKYRELSSDSPWYLKPFKENKEKIC